MTEGLCREAMLGDAAGPWLFAGSFYNFETSKMKLDCIELPKIKIALEGTAASFISLLPSLGSTSHSSLADLVEPSWWFSTITFSLWRIALNHYQGPR